MSNDNSKDVAYLEGYLNEHPDSMLFARLADLYLERNRVDEAVQLCENGIKKHPYYPTGHFVLGKSYLANKLFEQAEKEFKRVLLFDPKFLAAHRYYGDLMKEIGWENTSEVSYQKILQIDPLDEVTRSIVQEQSGGGAETKAAEASIHQTVQEIHPPTSEPTVHEEQPFGDITESEEIREITDRVDALSMPEPFADSGISLPETPSESADLPPDLDVESALKPSPQFGQIPEFEKMLEQDLASEPDPAMESSQIATPEHEAEPEQAEEPEPTMDSWQEREPEQMQEPEQAQEPDTAAQEFDPAPAADETGWEPDAQDEIGPEAPTQPMMPADFDSESTMETRSEGKVPTFALADEPTKEEPPSFDTGPPPFWADQDLSAISPLPVSPEEEDLLFRDPELDLDNEQLGTEEPEVEGVSPEVSETEPTLEQPPAQVVQQTDPAGAIPELDDQKAEQFSYILDDIFKDDGSDDFGLSTTTPEMDDMPQEQAEYDEQSSTLDDSATLPPQADDSSLPKIQFSEKQPEPPDPDVFSSPKPNKQVEPSSDEQSAVPPIEMPGPLPRFMSAPEPESTPEPPSKPKAPESQPANPFNLPEPMQSSMKPPQPSPPASTSMNVQDSVSPLSTGAAAGRAENVKVTPSRAGADKIVTPTLGEIYAAQGQYGKAIDVFETLIKKNPDNEFYHKKISALKQKMAEANA